MCGGYGTVHIGSVDRTVQSPARVVLFGTHQNTKCVVLAGKGVEVRVRTVHKQYCMIRNSRMWTVHCEFPGGVGGGRELVWV